MKAEDDDLPPENDWSTAVRGRYAERFTPAEREQFLRRAADGMVQEVGTYALEQVRFLEAALFTFFVLARNQSVQSAARHAAAILDGQASACAEEALGELNRGGGADPDLLNRLRALVDDREWLSRPRKEPYEGSGSFNPVMDRLDAIYREARDLRTRVENLIQEQLSSSGLSSGDIERKADQTAKLWLAA